MSDVRITNRRFVSQQRFVIGLSPFYHSITINVS